MDPSAIEEKRIPAVRSLRSKFEQLATSSSPPGPSPSVAVAKVSLQQGSGGGGTPGGKVSGKLVIRRRPSLGSEIVGDGSVAIQATQSEATVFLAPGQFAARPRASSGPLDAVGDPVKRPTGIKRPPPPPPQPVQIQQSLRVSSPSRGSQINSNGSSPAVSPLLRPVPAPPASIRASSSRPPSRNGAGSDTSLNDEIEELSQAPSMASLKSKL